MKLLCKYNRENLKPEHDLEDIDDIIDMIKNNYKNNYYILLNIKYKLESIKNDYILFNININMDCEDLLKFVVWLNRYDIYVIRIFE